MLCKMYVQYMLTHTHTHTYILYYLVTCNTHKKITNAVMFRSPRRTLRRTSGSSSSRRPANTSIYACASPPSETNSAYVRANFPRLSTARLLTTFTRGPKMRL